MKGLKHFLTYSLMSLSLLVLASGCDNASGGQSDGPPYAPDEALSTFEVADGFRVELFAAEPLVEDPVAMEIDEAGRMYVVESHGYPTNRGGVSKVKQLTDTDGDGRPDQSTVFADSLRMPKGLMRWKGGLLVTDAPDVLYLEDTNGDGRADKKEVMLTGFDDNNPQLGVNTPVYGLDNWIHLAHMSGSDSVRFTEQPGQTYDVSGRNVRLRPETHKLEPLAFRSQFGHTFDRWGRHLLNSNSNHIYQGVLPGRYLERNPHLLVSSTTEVISDHGAAAKVYPITEGPEYQLFTDAGVVTSACGLTCYLGGAFPPAYRNATFVAENVHNLVHVDKISDGGATLTARRMQEEEEFLASTDSWFRPVNFYVGPEGALYVIDYYRDIIEQPKFLADEVLASKNVYAGSDRGRIYRIVPEEAEAAGWLGALTLDEASASELVQALEKDNIWWRRIAQRLLVHRQDASAVGLLEQMAQGSPRPTARLHALWTLEGLGSLTPALIKTALKDKTAGVRENAIRLAERHLEEAPSLADALVAVGPDPEASVRYQLLLTLGYLSTEPAQKLRQAMLFENVENKWMQLAALSASDVQPRALFDQAITRLTGKQTKARQAFFRRIATMVGASDQEASKRRILSMAADTTAGAAWWRAASLVGLTEGMEQGQTPVPAVQVEQRRLASRFFVVEGPVRRAILKALAATGLPPDAQKEALMQKAVKAAADLEADPEMRADAVRLLELGDPSAHVNLLEQLIQPQEPAPVQEAAVRAVGQVEGEGVGEMLLSRWGGMTPSVRSQAVNALISEPGRVRLLLDAIEEGTVQPSIIGRQRIKQLIGFEDAALRRRARALLTQQKSERRAVLERYRDVLHAEGSVSEGRQVFDRACAQCHQVGGQGGVAFGPDLATVKGRTREWLLTHILLPNKSVAEGFELWTIDREGHQPMAGVITSETSTSITVRGAGGQKSTLPRADIQSMSAAQTSVMPAGLEAQISNEEMADLLSFLRQNKL